MPNQSFIGRRKTSTARVHIQPGKGNFLVNKKEVSDYFNTQAHANKAVQPMDLTETSDKYDVKVTVRGGGMTGQSGAIQMALARAIDSLEEDKHEILKKNGMLTRDDRMTERKKYGQPKARKKSQFSKR